VAVDAGSPLNDFGKATDARHSFEGNTGLR
jgi:hypothetical protein